MFDFIVITIFPFRTMTTAFLDKKREIHENLLIEEINWETEKHLAGDIWAEGFRLIIPLYWREVVFHPKYFFPSLFCLVFISVIPSYFFSQWWHGVIIGLVLEAILLAGCYKWYVLFEI